MVGNKHVSSSSALDMYYSLHPAREAFQLLSPYVKLSRMYVSATFINQSTFLLKKRSHPIAIEVAIRPRRENADY